MATFERVRRIIADETYVGQDQVTAETKLAQDFGVDSLTRVQIAMKVEDEFGIEFDDEVVDTLETVGEIVAFVDAQLAARASS